MILNTDSQATPVNLRSRLAVNFGQLLVGKVVTTVLGLLYLTINSRYLGPEQYGQLVTATVFVGLFIGFSDFGVNAVVVREARGDRQVIKDLTNANLGLSVLLVLPLSAVVAVAGLLTYGVGTRLTHNILLLLPFLATTLITSCFLPVFQHRNSFTGQVVADLASAVLTLAGIVLGVARHAGVTWFVVVIDVAAVSRLLITAGYCSRLERLRPTVDRQRWLFLLRTGLPIGVGGLIGVIYYRVDTVLLSLLVPGVQVGFYSLAYRLVGSLSVVPAILGSLFYSSLVQVNDEPATLTRRVRIFVGLSLGAGIPLSVLGGVLAPELMTALGGPAYRGAAGALVLMLIATSFSFVNNALSTAMVSMHRQAFLVKLGLTMLLVNIGANLLLDVRYGAKGAALALLLSEAGSSLVVVTVVHRTTSLAPPLAKAAGFVAATVGLGLVATLTRDLFLAIPLGLGALTFVLILLATRVVRVSDVLSLRQGG